MPFSNVNRDFLGATTVEVYDPQINTVMSPELYLKLKTRVANDGQVLIAHPGEIMMGNLAVYGDGNRRWLVAYWGETYRVNCPFCTDTRHRLWLNYQYGQPDPVDPNRRGNFYGICFNEDCLADYENRIKLFETLFDFRNRNEQRPTLYHDRGFRADGPLVRQTMPGGCIDLNKLPDHDSAIQYIIGDRRFSRQTISTYGLMFCVAPDERYSIVTNRIVAPIIFDNQLMGWQARYVGEPPSKFIPKYFTCPGMRKGQLLYNYDAARNHPFVVVFEGITDVWRCGPPGVALLGKTMTWQQRQLLQTTWERKPIIVVLDPEAQEESALALYQLQQSGQNPVVVVQLPSGADPASLERITLWTIIREQARLAGVHLPVMA